MTVNKTKRIVKQTYRLALFKLADEGLFSCLDYISRPMSVDVHMTGTSYVIRIVKFKPVVLLLLTSQGCRCIRESELFTNI
jgi:hypothetical protein